MTDSTDSTAVPEDAQTEAPSASSIASDAQTVVEVSREEFDALRNLVHDGFAALKDVMAYHGTRNGAVAVPAPSDGSTE